jgi:hypothetical protein
MLAGYELPWSCWVSSATVGMKRVRVFAAIDLDAVLDELTNRDGGQKVQFRVAKTLNFRLTKAATGCIFVGGRGTFCITEYQQ